MQKKVITSCDCDGLQKWLYFIIRRFISAAALFSIRFVCLFLLYLTWEESLKLMASALSNPFHFIYSVARWRCSGERWKNYCLSSHLLRGWMRMNENERMRWEIWRWKKNGFIHQTFLSQFSQIYSHKQWLKLNPITNNQFHYTSRAIATAAFCANLIKK